MLTRLLVAINVIVYLWERTTGGLDTNQGLLSHGALLGSQVQAGEWWRIFTGAFLHGSDMHILFNMIALWQVGSFVELIYGTPRMAIIYLLSAIGSGLLVTYVSPNDITVGASGAIFGLFGALLVAGLQMGERGRSLVKQTAVIIAINLVLTFSIPNISWTGHIGGLLAGIVCGFIVFRRPVPVAQPVEGPQYAQRIDPRDDPGVITIEHPAEPVQHDGPL